MKYLYQCDYCGKTYESQDEAWSCEASHASIDTWSKYESQLTHFAKWKTDEPMPVEVALASNNFYFPGEQEPRTLFGLYKLTRHLTDEEVNKIEQEYAKRHEEG